MSDVVNKARDVATGGVVPSLVDQVAGTNLAGTVRRNLVPGALGFLQGGPIGAGLAVGANELQRSQAGAAQSRLQQGIASAQDIQRLQLQQQQRARQEARQINQPFLDQALAARQQLAQLAASPLGQGADIDQKRALALRNVRRALSSQGSAFSGRFGDAAANIELGLLGQQSQQRQQALSTLAGGYSLAPTLTSAVQPQTGGFTNLSQLSLLRGQANALANVGQSNQLNQLLGLALNKFGGSR